MPQQLRALGPRHHSAIRLKLEGASGSEIAETLGVEVRTVYLWMGDPLVKQELPEQLERIGDEFARQLALAAMVAVSQLKEAVQLPLAARFRLSKSSPSSERLWTGLSGSPGTLVERTHRPPT